MIKGIGLNMISLVGNRNSVTNICNIYTEFLCLQYISQTMTKAARI